MRLPDYHGGSIVNLMASLQEGLGGGRHAYPPGRLLPPERVRGHRQVMLLVIDGLGLNYLRAHPEAACLNALLLGGVTSVYPPTTASAVTTYLTGDAPQQHGLTGWHMYFRELGSVLAVLPGRARYGGAGLQQSGVDPVRLFGHTPFSDRIPVEAHTLSPNYIADSDFNLAHLGRAQSHGFSDLGDLLAKAATLLRKAGPRFVYAYWPELDSLGHREGIWSDAAQNHLLELEVAFERFLGLVGGTDTLVIACADHGQIDTRPEDRILVEDHPILAETLALPLCGEPRSVYCYLRPGLEAQFDDYVRRGLAEVADGYPSSSVLDSGVFGLGEPHPELIRRIGDRVLMMKAPYVLKDWLPQESRYDMIGVHGGVTDDEIWVPLIVAET